MAQALGLTGVMIAALVLVVVDFGLAIRLWASVPLTVLDSPYRDMTRPAVEYVAEIRRRSPRDVVAVYVPEYVVEHWWEQLLHNQSALRLKTRLLFQPGVMVTSVPYRLGREVAAPHPAPVDVPR